jgi:Cu+-exporting ATPase
MTQLVTLKIDGMTCASCVARVEKALTKVDGVNAASVNLATEKAQIRLSGDALPEMTQALVQSVQKAGYEAYEEHQTRPASKKSLDLYGTPALIGAIVLSLPLVLPMVFMPLGIHWMLPVVWQFILASVIQFFMGSRFYRVGFKAVLSGSGNMDLLVAIGTSAAYGLSVYVWWQSGWSEHAEVYFESSALVITLVMLGKWLEARAKREATQAIAALQNLRPTRAKLLCDSNDLSQYQWVDIEHVLPGDLILINPGESIPADGIVVVGDSGVDESMLTGESRLIDKFPGAVVTGGSLNGMGVLVVKATAIGEGSVLAHLIQLIEDAQANKAPIQRLVDQVSAWFVPVVIVLSLINFIVSFFVFNMGDAAILHSVAMLVIACPCALGLATPAAIMAGTGVAAKHGILIKDAQALELAHRIDVVAFDKTGTLTAGSPQVVAFKSYGVPDQQALALAFGLQAGSEHPLAKAIIAFAKEHQVHAAEFEGVQAVAGRGIEGISKDVSCKGHRLAILSHHAFEQIAVEFGEVSQQALGLAHDYLEQGYSVSYLLNQIDHQVLAVFGFADQIKSGSVAAIEKLKRLGIQTILLSGDHDLVASRVGQQLGIDEIYGSLSPADKSARLLNLKKQYRCVAMVGDGVNDAPALAVADVGIAMATGTDVAMHVSGVTLMRGDPLLVADAIEISKKTWSKIRQNLFWAFIYNIIGIPLAALGMLSPVIAGAAMAASSVSVITNALLLKRWSRVSAT